MEHFLVKQSLGTDSFTACLDSHETKHSLRAKAGAGRHEKCVGGVPGTVPSLVSVQEGKGEAWGSLMGTFEEPRLTLLQKPPVHVFPRKAHAEL